MRVRRVLGFWEFSSLTHLTYLCDILGYLLNILMSDFSFNVFVHIFTMLLGKRMRSWDEMEMQTTFISVKCVVDY